MKRYTSRACFSLTSWPTVPDVVRDWLASSTRLWWSRIDMLRAVQRDRGRLCSGRRLIAYRLRAGHVHITS